MYFRMHKRIRMWYFLYSTPVYPEVIVGDEQAAGTDLKFMLNFKNQKRGRGDLGLIFHFTKFNFSTRFGLCQGEPFICPTCLITFGS